MMSQIRVVGQFTLTLFSTSGQCCKTFLASYISQKTVVCLSVFYRQTLPFLVLYLWVRLEPTLVEHLHVLHNCS